MSASNGNKVVFLQMSLKTLRFPVTYFLLLILICIVSKVSDNVKLFFPERYKHPLNQINTNLVYSWGMTYIPIFVENVYGHLGTRDINGINITSI